MRASLIQIAVDENESVAARRERVAALVVDTARSAGSGFVVLPELWTIGAFAYDFFASEAEPLRGPTYETMAKAAREAGVWLHAGSIPERAPAEEGAAEGVIYNTSLVFSPQGELAAAYRKIHRFGFNKGEALLMGAGSALVTVLLPDTTVGVATCYDLRFPELFRGLVDVGAETLVISAGWPARRCGHWTLLARARAVENQAYVLACGTAGSHAGVEQAGHSIIVDPWGKVLAEAGAEEETLTADLDPKLVATARENFPVLKDRMLGLASPRR